MNRRHFIAAGTALALPGSLALVALRERAADPTGVFLSAFEDLPGDQYVGGLSLPDGRVFASRVPVRAHGSAIDPANPQRVLFFARRPGTQVFALDLATLKVQPAFETPPGRHLAGHGVFSTDGAFLFTPEHDYETQRGVIGIRDTRAFRLVGEIDTQGLDPHELAWLPDGRTLVVANGGILTHPRTFRRKLNLDTMDPSLCLIEVGSGVCVAQHRLPDHRLSIRHLAVTTEGVVAVGLQFEGPPELAPSVGALYRPDRGFELLDVPQAVRGRLAGYVASVAVSTAQDVIAMSCPLGRGIARWHLGSGAWRGFTPAGETYGLATDGQGLLVASQRDGSAHWLTGTEAPEPVDVAAAFRLRWDDHWQLASSNTRPPRAI